MTQWERDAEEAAEVSSLIIWDFFKKHDRLSKLSECCVDKNTLFSVGEGLEL